MKFAIISIIFIINIHVYSNPNLNLLKSVKTNNVIAVIHEIRNGADINVRTEDKETPLIIAAKNGNLKIVKLLVENGAKINLFDFGHYSALTWAFTRNHVSIVRFLVKHKANVNVADSNLHTTPLIWAVLRHDIQMVQLLIKHGANVNLKTFKNVSALFAACKKGYLEIVKILLKAKAKINVTDIKKRCLLVVTSMAVNTQVPEDNYVEIIKLLVRNGLQIKKCFFCPSALYIAAGLGKIKIVKVLLKLGAKVNRPVHNNGNYSILQNAVRNGRTHIVKILLKHRAYPNHRNVLGQTALTIAKQKGFIGIVNLLLRYGAR